MNSPALFDPAVRANRPLLSFFLFAFERARSEARSRWRGPVCCVSVTTDARTGAQEVQLTRCAPVTTQEAIAELFATLPPGSIVGWFHSETAIP